MTTIREYFLLVAFLLALAVTGYIQVSKLLVNAVQQPFINLERNRK